ESFFEADHKVILNGREDVIDNHQKFDEIFEAEKTELLSDERLRNINQKLLTGVASVKTMQTILEEHPELVVDLEDIGLLKKIIW
ncbi:phage infection protein, partial [Vibrio cholerae]|nr:phage infection protein [Vibrio cholerae]